MVLKQTESGCVISLDKDYGTPAFYLLFAFFVCYLLFNIPPPYFFLAPARRPADLQSAVKKCPNLFRLCGFEIRSKGVWLLAHTARNSERSGYGS